jgi:thioesterase domain-containing protein
MSASPADDARRNPAAPAALQTLLARVSRGSERVIIPINDCALSDDALTPSLYCVHALSGAGGADFADLGRLMPDVRIFGIQAPPKKMWDMAFGGSVQAVADYYVDALVRFQPNGPLLLGGWSAGASIALEMAQQLTKIHGRDVSLLVAFDAAPENSAAGLRPWNPRYLAELARNLPAWFAQEGIFEKGFLRSLRRQFSKKIVALAKTAIAYARGDQMAASHAVEGFMDLARFPPFQRSFMKRLYDSLLRYKPAPYAGRVLVYEAEVKPLYHVPQVARIWRAIAAPVEIVCVEGTTHLSILRNPNVQALADDLQERIAHL